MNVDPSFIVHIAFKDTPLADGIDTWAMLNMICIRVEAVVDEFRPLSGNSRATPFAFPGTEIRDSY